MRRTALKPPTLEQVRAWSRRPRTRIRARGKRAQREQPALDAFRAALKERSDGWCEASGMLTYEDRRLVCGTIIVHEGAECHHVVKRSRGTKHDPAEGLYLCVNAHRFTELEVKRSTELGLLRSRREG